MITPAQSRAARALLGWSRARVATESGLDASAIEDFESGDAAKPLDAPDGLIAALEQAGVAFLADGDGGGPGVRFKFNRKDVKQIDRMENEGGPVAEDDI